MVVVLDRRGILVLCSCSVAWGHLSPEAATDGGRAPLCGLYLQGGSAMWSKSSFTIPAVAAISFCLIGATTPAHADLGEIRRETRDS